MQCDRSAHTACVRRYMIKLPYSFRKTSKMSSNLSRVDEIEDMKDCCDVMTAFGLPTKGYKTLDEMKTTLNKHLKDLEGTSTRKVGEVSTQPPIVFVKNKYRLVRYQLIVIMIKQMLRSSLVINMPLFYRLWAYRLACSWSLAEARDDDLNDPYLYEVKTTIDKTW